MPKVQHNIKIFDNTVSISYEKKISKKIKSSKKNNDLDTYYKSSLNSFFHLYSNIPNQIKGRFRPALNHISHMNLLEILIGKRIGSTFDIPWFKWRGLDTNGNTIDSMYLTFFVKYGVFGTLFIIYLFLKMINFGFSNIKLKYSISLFYLSLFLLLSTLYQAGAIAQIMFILVFSNSLTSKKQGIKSIKIL